MSDPDAWPADKLAAEVAFTLSPMGRERRESREVAMALEIERRRAERDAAWLSGWKSGVDDSRDAASRSGPILCFDDYASGQRSGAERAADAIAALPVPGREKDAAGVRAALNIEPARGRKP